MSPTAHIIISTATGSIYGLIMQSWIGGIICFLAGILIDIDHWFDYCLHKGKPSMDVKEFLDYCMYHWRGRIYLIFHSYEFMLLLWILTTVLEWPFWWISALFGMSVHLVLDQVFNDVDPLVYFWIYRMRKNFSKILFHAHR